MLHLCLENTKHGLLLNGKHSLIEQLPKLKLLRLVFVRNCSLQSIEEPSACQFGVVASHYPFSHADSLLLAQNPVSPISEAYPDISVIKLIVGLDFVVGVNPLYKGILLKLFEIVFD